MTSSMPTSAATALAVVSLSPVSRTGRSPSAFRRCDGLDGGRLDGVGDDEDGLRLAVPAGGDGGLPLGLGGSAGGVELAREVHRPVREQGRPTHDDGVAVDDALDTEAFAVGEALDGWQLVLGGRGRGDGLGDGVLGGVLQRARPAAAPARGRRPRRARCRRGSSCRW